MSEYVVKALAPHESGKRAKESRCYATGIGSGGGAAWTSLRRNAFVCRGIDLMPDAGKAIAERLRNALTLSGSVPEGKRAAVVRVFMKRKKVSALRLFRVDYELDGFECHAWFVAKDEPHAFALFREFDAPATEPAITRYDDDQLVTLPDEDGETRTLVAALWCKRCGVGLISGVRQ